MTTNLDKLQHLNSASEVAYMIAYDLDAHVPYEAIKQWLEQESEE